MKDWSLAQFQRWLSGRTNCLVFITGPTGAGKTTLVSNLGAKLAFKVALPGKYIRSKPELLAQVKRAANPTAVPELEKLVRSYVTKKIRQAEHGRSVAVDGMPRTVEQVTWCVDQALDYEKTLIFVYLDAPKSERGRRLSTRDHVGDDEIRHRRFENDDLVMPQVMARISQVVVHGRLGFFFMINTEKFDDGRQIDTEPGVGDSFSGTV